jgi:hypothetical protein
MGAMRYALAYQFLTTGVTQMKTFQIFKNVSYEYFVEAETLEDAQTKIIEENPEHESEELIEWVYADEHDGVNWTYEPVTQS